MDNEKKFKLDELPDKGSEPAEVKIPKIPRKTKPEPRIESLKTLSDRDRLEALSQRWYFDQPVRLWGWFYCLGVLFVIHQGKFLTHLQAERQIMEERSFGLSEILLPAQNVDFFLRNPLIFAIFIPFIFKFKKASDLFFEITFGGIHTVRSIIIPPHQTSYRVQIKWDEIARVERGTSKNRDILILYNNEGVAGEMIWDIDMVKKKVIKRLLMGLVSNKHPMRQFIEKDVD